MGCISLDLTIDKALADPVIGAAMRADGVDPGRFEALLRATARDLDEARGPTPFTVMMAERLRGAVTGAKPRW